MAGFQICLLKPRCVKQMPTGILYDHLIYRCGLYPGSTVKMPVRFQTRIAKTNHDTHRGESWRFWLKKGPELNHDAPTMCFTEFHRISKTDQSDVRSWRNLLAPRTATTVLNSSKLSYGHRGTCGMIKNSQGHPRISKT